jgi:glutathione synthase/RimK-type ligase-like ATP-grasp enzyme
MDYFSLNYGAIDIILTPDNRHVFLELNPSGEFFWLEQTPGLPISDAIARPTPQQKVISYKKAQNVPPRC